MTKHMDHLSGVSQEMINSKLNDYAKRCEELRTRLATVTAERDEVREKLEQIADSRNYTKLIMEDALGRSQHLEKLLAGAERELAAARERVEKLKKQQDALISTIARDKKFWDEDKERLEKLEKVREAANRYIAEGGHDLLTQLTATVVAARTETAKETT